MEWGTRGREVESGRRGRYATWRDWIITNWDERAGTRSEGGGGVEEDAGAGTGDRHERIEFSEKMQNPQKK